MPDCVYDVTSSCGLASGCVRLDHNVLPLRSAGELGGVEGGGGEGRGGREGVGRG